MYLVDDVLISSGYDFEGYKIQKYLGFLSGETALGTGFLSEYTASFSDFFGIESNSFSNKLRQAKSASIRKLKQLVHDIGGNAIIGVDIDYHTFTGNMIGVIASGTAVIVEKISTIDSHIFFRSNIPAVNYNLASPIRPLYLNISQFENFIELEIWFRQYNEDVAEYLQCQIILLTVFGDEIDVGKKSLKVSSSDTRLYAKIAIPLIEDIQIVNGGKIIIKKIYGEKLATNIDIEKEAILSINDIEQLRSNYNSDVVTQARAEENCWICSCGTSNIIGNPCSLCGRTMESAISFNLEEFICEVEQLDSSVDILKFFKSLDLSDDDLYIEIETILKNNTILEKTYKNTKKDTMIQLKRLLS